MKIVRLDSFPCRLTERGILEHFRREVNRQLPKWRERLAHEPSCLGEIEEEVLAWSRTVAALLTAAVLRCREVEESVAEQGEAIRREAAHRPQKVYRRPRRVVLLCGLVLTVMCWYCAPRRKRGGVGRRGKERVGLYPEWAALGIREGASPGLQSEAARLVVLMPSMEAGRAELKRRGCELDVKTVRRLALELGAQALAARKEDLEAWRREELSAGNEFAGKRIAVADVVSNAKSAAKLKHFRLVCMPFLLRQLSCSSSKVAGSTSEKSRHRSKRHSVVMLGLIQ